jgi:hypothetical protein
MSTIVNRILDLESVDDHRVKKLLHNKSEIKMAMKMTAILTKALTFSMEDQPDDVKTGIADSDRGKRTIQPKEDVARFDLVNKHS